MSQLFKIMLYFPYQLNAVCSICPQPHPDSEGPVYTAVKFTAVSSCSAVQRRPSGFLPQSLSVAITWSLKRARTIKTGQILWDVGNRYFSLNFLLKYRLSSNVVVPDGACAVAYCAGVIWHNYWNGCCVASCDSSIESQCLCRHAMNRAYTLNGAVWILCTNYRKLTV